MVLSIKTEVPSVFRLPTHRIIPPISVHAAFLEHLTSDLDVAVATPLITLTACASIVTGWHEMAKVNRKPTEAVKSRYTALPHALLGYFAPSLLDSVAFMGASHRARSLLLDMMRQHNGGNNGFIHGATGWLRKRGWASTGQIQKAKMELIERGLIVRTKAGGLNAGPDLFALTWLPVSNFVGLDLKPAQYHQGAWSLLNPVPAIGSKGTEQSIIVIAPAR